MKPSLCHGDLWGGNIQVDVEQTILFQSSAVYGHAEGTFILASKELTTNS
jgi:fructosamine-3-kinase